MLKTTFLWLKYRIKWLFGWENPIITASDGTKYLRFRNRAIRRITPKKQIKYERKSTINPFPDWLIPVF